MEYIYELEMKVRDYECDLQGVVNNGVYMNYLEHTRHEFLLDAGIDFEALHHEGIDAMVLRAELDYKAPLKSKDVFVCRVNCVQEGRLRILFMQDIYRKEDNKLMLKAVITGVCVRNGRPIEPKAEVFDKLEAYKNRG